MKKMKKKLKYTQGQIKRIKTKFSEDLANEIENKHQGKMSQQRILLNYLSEEIKNAVEKKLTIAAITRLINKNIKAKISSQTVKNFITQNLKMTIEKKQKKNKSDIDEIDSMLNQFK